MLAENKFEVIADGEKFVWIVPAGISNSPVMRHLKRIQRPKSASDIDESKARSIPAGMIHFQNMPTEQVLTIFSELAHRTILRPARLSTGPISLFTQTELTRDELFTLSKSSCCLTGW